MSTDTKKKRGPRKKVDRPRIPGAPYTVDQAAAALNLAPRTLRRRIAEGNLRAYRDGHAVRVTEADLAEYQAKLLYPMGAPDRPMGTGTARRRHLKSRPSRA